MQRLGQQICCFILSTCSTLCDHPGNTHVQISIALQPASTAHETLEFSRVSLRLHCQHVTLVPQYFSAKFSKQTVQAKQILASSQQTGITATSPESQLQAQHAPCRKVSHAWRSNHNQCLNCPFATSRARGRFVKPSAFRFFQSTQRLSMTFTFFGPSSNSHVSFQLMRQFLPSWP
jgi:hypothetical protein